MRARRRNVHEEERDARAVACHDTEGKKHTLGNSFHAWRLGTMLSLVDAHAADWEESQDRGALVREDDSEDDEGGSLPHYRSLPARIR